MIDIDSVMRDFCNAGAQAVLRYVVETGEDPWNMPEYFMPAFILDHLGDKITATLETNFNTLVQWNAGVRKRHGLAQQAHDERSLSLTQQLDQRRVDMVLFEGQEEQKPKDQQDFLALIEFKRGQIDAGSFPGKISDRDKLLMFLAQIDTCPWGVACGWVDEPHLEWQKNESIKGTDDRWFEKRIELPEAFTIPHFFCARLFARSSDERRLKDLLLTQPG